MQEHGTMTPIWVQPHKEMEFTPDTILRSKRQSLAVVDEAAKASHLLTMQASYSRWIEYEDFMLIDEEGALVFGNTLAYLLKRVHGDQRRRWPLSRQQEKDESRHTLAQDEVVMIADSQWSEALRRFYWRARATVLHTNAIKHRYDPRWSAACSSGGDGITDTQDHRFGLTTPLCPDVSVLNDMLTKLFYKIDCEEWLPDQCIFIPAIAHQLATATGSDQRSGWLSKDPGKVLWAPMVRIVNELWVNAQWLDWFGDPRDLCLDSQFASVVERELSHTGRPRCILPAEFADVVQRYHTTVGFFRAYITQWIPGWSAATFQYAGSYTQFPGLEQLLPPARVRVWLVDDVYQPRSSLWWDNFKKQYEQQLRYDEPIYWIATYLHSAGHEFLESIDCAWILRIPAEELSMRTEFTVVHCIYY